MITTKNVSKINFIVSISEGKMISGVLIQVKQSQSIIVIIDSRNWLGRNIKVWFRPNRGNIIFNLYVFLIYIINFYNKYEYIIPFIILLLSLLWEKQYSF